MLKAVSSLSLTQETSKISNLTIHSCGSKGFVRLSTQDDCVTFSLVSTGTKVVVHTSMPLSLVLRVVGNLFREEEGANVTYVPL